MARACGGNPDVSNEALQPQPLSHPRQRGIRVRAGEVARGIDVGASRAAHRDAHRVADLAARDLVVADDGGEDRQARRVRGRPAARAAARSTSDRTSMPATPPSRCRSAAPARTRAAARSRDRRRSGGGRRCRGAGCPPASCPASAARRCPRCAPAASSRSARSRESETDPDPTPPGTSSRARGRAADRAARSRSSCRGCSRAASPRRCCAMMAAESGATGRVEMSSFQGLSGGKTCRPRQDAIGLRRVEHHPGRTGAVCALASRPVVTTSAASIPSPTKHRPLTHVVQRHRFVSARRDRSSSASRARSYGSPGSGKLTRSPASENTLRHDRRERRARPRRSGRAAARASGTDGPAARAGSWRAEWSPPARRCRGPRPGAAALLPDTSARRRR